MATISKLLLLPGNDSCADCNASNPKWASCSLGVFVCDSCAEVHRTLERPESQRSGFLHLGNALIGCNEMMLDPFEAGSSVPHGDDGDRLPALPRVQNIESARSTALSASKGRYGDGSDKHVVIHVTSPFLTANPQLIQAFTMGGNNAAKRHYESLVPVSYRRPVATDPRVLREEWIRSKYEREEFTDESNAERDRTLSHLGRGAALLTGNLAGGRRPCDSYQSGYKEGYLWKRGREDKRFNRRLFVLDQNENTLRYYNQDKIHEPKGTWRVDYVNAVILPEKIGHPYAMQLTFNNPGDPTRNIYVQAKSGKELIEWYSCIRWVKLKRLLKANPLQSPDEEAVARGEICLGTRDQGFYLTDSNGVETPCRCYRFLADNVDEKIAWIRVLHELVDPVNQGIGSAAAGLS